jgi:translation elongation factor EF-Ts
MQFKDNESTIVVNDAKLRSVRESSGAGIADCKEALIKNSFDVEKAIIFLKIKAGEIRVTQEFLDIYTKFENY